MSDILKQIQELQEQFDNLFEVDGLGNPAVDVPPSQNKIKRDRKTKDGKVEVVSVEDELFPYEGNKREQFRQKIIATINDMIQGTATLEDLLQLVRQKKAPLKEAAELLEQSIDEWFGKKEEKKPDPTKSAVGRTLRGKEAIYNQHTDDLEKYAKRADGATGHRAEVNAQRAADAERKAAEANKDFRHTKGEYLDLLKKRGLTNPQAHAMLRAAVGEAFEIMEAIINELHPNTVHKALDKRTDQSIEADDKDREEFNNILKIKDRDARIKAYTDFKKRTNDRFDKEGKKLDLYVNYVKRHPGELKIEEAIELMEEIISEVSNKTIENALTKANDKVVSGLFSFTGVDMNDVKKAKKLRELADRRAKRHGEKIEEDPDTGEHKHIKEALNILIEGRKEGESQEDFKHRLHGELVRAIDNKAVKAREEAIEGKKGAYEKYKKEHDKLGKLDDIEPVANAYCEALDKVEEVAKKLNELFDRPDLLDDIDTMLGSPVKKAKDKLLKQIFEPKKEKKEEKKETCLKK